MPDEILHIPAARCRVPTGCRVLLAAIVLGHGSVLGGCAVSVPMGSLMPAGVDGDITGSLADVPFGQLLDAEDRRREKSALATALDPQGDGSTVRWDNPKSGTKGSITAEGHAFPNEHKVCRGFSSDLARVDTQRTMHGVACLVATGVWEVKDLTESRKG